MSQVFCHGLPQTRTCAHCHATTSGRQTSPVFAAHQYPAPRSFVGLKHTQALERVRLVKFVAQTAVLCTTCADLRHRLQNCLQSQKPSPRCRSVNRFRVNAAARESGFYSETFAQQRSCCSPKKTLVHCAKRCLYCTAPREVPLDTYRNIGIMAHIDAGKVRLK